MSRRLNLLLLAVLIAVVPLRGFAATMMAGSGMHGAASGIAAVVPTSPDAVAMAHCADHANAAADHDAPATDDGGDQHAACTICTACCTASAMVQAAWRGASMAPAVPPFAFEHRALTGHIPAGIDRPPLSPDA